MIENKVIVIDSGISHKYVETHNIKLFKVKNLCCRDIGEIEDKAGHGTSIVNIIHSIAPNSEFLLIKIYDNVLQQSIEVLIDALKYVYDLDIRNSIVHMSVGIDFYSKEIEALCEAICNKSNILIAAFDNMGCISYPASLDCVIGVEGNILCNKISDFIVNQNSIVDVYAKGGNHRVLDKDCLPIIRQGNSYSAAFVTGVLANKRLDGYSKNYALKKLECLSTSRGTLNKNENNYFDLELKLSDKEKDNIGRVGVFPYNKEIKTLVRYADYLEFELVNVYSSKYLRNINIEIYNKNQTVSYIIRDIEDISLSEIDTLIIGHISQLDYLIPNIKQNILLKCLKSNINVYSLDTDLLNNFLPKFNEKDLMIRCPIINKNNIKKNGKLYQISIPVVAVLGTSSNQGKFSLQIELIRQFKKMQYVVGFLASEPTGELFGADRIFPYGYEGIRDISDYEFIDLINTQLHEIEMLGKEIIITGAQSRAIPQSAMNLGTMAIKQLEYILAVQPDVVLLCVNFDDDMDYVLRTINIIENLSVTKVIGLVMFPLKYKNAWAKQKEKMELVPQVNLQKKVSEVHEYTNINVYVAGRDEKEICQTIIDYF